jgi:hypothetical protein
MKSPMICSIAMVVALVGFSPVARALDQVPILSLDLARDQGQGDELENEYLGGRQWCQPNFL